MLRNIGVSLYPWLAATAPIFLLAAVNIDQIEAHTLTIPLAAALLLATLLFVAARFWVRSWQGAAAWATIAIACFFAHGHVLSLLPFLRGDTGHAVIGLLSLTLLTVAASMIRRSPERGPRLSAMVMPFATLFFILSVGQFGYAFMNRQRAALPLQLTNFDSAPAVTGSTQLPDIYYIILDGYARGDRLKEFYGFDNSDFLHHLGEEGFYVADKSKSNYAATFLSLASSLNMRYLDADVSGLTKDSADRHGLYHLLKNNFVGQFLKSKGYHYVHINTNWGGTESSEIADSAYPETIAEFHDVLIGTTILEPFADEFGLRQHQLIRSQLDAVTQCPPMDQPKFVFAHLICPHPPFCFDKDGKAVVVPVSESWTNKDGYLGQVQFINSEMKRIVAEIKRQSSRPPIIIIQADHGTASQEVAGAPAAEQTALIRERMPILNTYLVPPETHEKLYPSITPVNSFRLILGDLFTDEKFPLMDDRSFFSWYEHPYDFLDVSRQVD